jgi:hypothetical protein
MQALWDKLEREAVESTNAPAATNAPVRRVDACELVSLAGETLAGRFRHWRGASGRRYVFSLYDASACPAYDDAVLIVAAKRQGEDRRILAICDTGALPELAVARAREAAASLGARVECHVHLLAGSRAERAAVIDDLGYHEAS